MHIIRRGGVYYYRRRIPSDLIVAHSGQREVCHSLVTKDRAEAERKARRTSVALDDRWASMRGFPVGDAETVGRDTFGLTLNTPAARPVGQDLTAAPGQAAAPRLLTGRNRETLQDLLPHWQRERKPTSKTVDQYSRAVQEFNELHGNPALPAITRRMVVEYRDQLQAQGKAVGTINDRISVLRALLVLAIDRDMIQANPATDAALPPDRRAVDARKPYSAEQATVVLTKTEQYRDMHPARYWLPRLARWTGARLNELHQLRRQDLVIHEGIRGIRITDHGECLPGLAMRLKNPGSRRWVPLHAELAAFWEWAQTRPEGALFPDKPNTYGIISDNFSKWYGRQRTRWGITDPQVSFHSWRHSFADLCRASGIAPEIRMALMGHAESGTAGAYGAGQMPIAVLSGAMKALAKRVERRGRQ